MLDVEFLITPKADTVLDEASKRIINYEFENYQEGTGS